MTGKAFHDLLGRSVLASARGEASATADGPEVTWPFVVVGRPPLLRAHSVPFPVRLASGLSRHLFANIGLLFPPLVRPSCRFLYDYRIGPCAV